MVDNNSIFNKLIMINYFIPILKIWDVKSKKILKKKPLFQEAFRNVVNMWTLTLIKSFYINILTQYKKPHLALLIT